MNRLDNIEGTQLRNNIPQFQPGDTVRVHVRIKESETKERLQVFEGVVIDAVVRLLPGALGSETSAVFESFSEGLLDHPQYTRPPEFRGMKVPEVLLSGNHAEIERWRKEAAIAKTRRKRPDLLKE